MSEHDPFGLSAASREVARLRAEAATLRASRDALAAENERLRGAIREARVWLVPLPHVAGSREALALLNAAVPPAKGEPKPCKEHVFASYQGPGECVVCGALEEPSQFTVLCDYCNEPDPCSPMCGCGVPTGDHAGVYGDEPCPDRARRALAGEGPGR